MERRLQFGAIEGQQIDDLLAFLEALTGEVSNLAPPAELPT